MLLNMLRLFGPGVTDLLRVMWSPEGGGAGAGAGNDGGVGGGGKAEPGAGTSEQGNAAGGGDSAASSAGSLEQVMADLSVAVGELIESYRGLPEVVPEMITGTTVAEVKASLERSRTAFAVVKAQLSAGGTGGGGSSGAGSQAGQGTQGGAGRVAIGNGTGAGVGGGGVVPVAAGGGARRAAGGEGLTPLEKIARGLEQRQGLSR